MSMLRVYTQDGGIVDVKDIRPKQTEAVHGAEQKRLHKNGFDKYKQLLTNR